MAMMIREPKAESEVPQWAEEPKKEEEDDEVYVCGLKTVFQWMLEQRSNYRNRTTLLNFWTKHLAGSAIVTTKIGKMQKKGLNS